MPAPRPAWRTFRRPPAIDFSQYELDEPIQYVKSNAIQSATKNLQNNDWTRRKLLEQHALGGRYITLVGSPEQVADELESWISETGLDGFNLTRIVTPESYVDFIDLVVPELQRRGRTRPHMRAARCAKKSSTAVLAYPNNTPAPPTATEQKCGRGLAPDSGVQHRLDAALRYREQALPH